MMVLSHDAAAHYMIPRYTYALSVNKNNAQTDRYLEMNELGFGFTQLTARYHNADSSPVR